MILNTIFKSISKYFSIPLLKVFFKSTVNLKHKKNHSSIEDITPFMTPNLPNHEGASSA